MRTKMGIMLAGITLGILIPCQVIEAAQVRVLGVDELRDKYKWPYLITCEAGADRGRVCNATNATDRTIAACCGADGIIMDVTPAPRKGMTWAKYSHTAALGTDLVGCNVEPKCNPYEGDTLCSEVLSVLCIKEDGSPDPGIPSGRWRSWAAGHIAVTPPLPGDELKSLEHANSLCSELHGEGWRMAQHHDGVDKKGWMFEAYGNVTSSQRFWVYISDRPGNCWNH